MVKRQRSLLLVFVVVALGIFVTCQNCWLHQARAKSIENKVYIASGHPEWSPIMWRKGDRIVGAGPQLVEKIMAELGLAVEVRYEGSWSEVQAKMRTGELDILVAAYRTSERALYMDYSIA
ncbi:transporter substrate-binding domain-containing protein [Candidatus Aerophobetes bacterium]|nr:transporter substrate-binding domain-containing protein [Candidatus Aerophobetes bacterium]